MRALTSVARGHEEKTGRGAAKIAELKFAASKAKSDDVKETKSEFAWAVVPRASKPKEWRAQAHQEGARDEIDRTRPEREREREKGLSGAMQGEC